MTEENVMTTENQENKEQGFLNKAKNIVQTKWFVYVCCAIFIALLFVRDAMSVGINKYLFVGLTIAIAIVMTPKQLIHLFCCLFPLYVGLPGNYMTIIFILKLMFDYKNFKMQFLPFVFAVLMGAFILLSELSVETTNMVHIMFIPGIFLVLILASYKELPIKDMIVAFCIGVASMGLIMLISTLQVYEFEKLLSESYRLGAANVNYTEVETMNVSMDPNFFGMFAVAVISLGMSLVAKKKVNKAEAVAIVLSVLACLGIAFIGQSRAFILVFVVWIVLFMLSLRNKKAILISIAGLAVVVLAVFVVMPDVMNAVFERFLGEDMLTLNNRTTITTKYIEEMMANPLSIFGGLYFFGCNIHCLPLQVFFGGGLILSIIMVGFIISLMSKENKVEPKHFLAKWCPVIVTVFMSLTVPAAQLLNFMFPIIIAGLYAKHINKILD
ncbi:MAG: hypothetical protein IJF76_05435 [Clostridia bacterium]|nr:hypothetical protein [Clostridia bacterium]